MRDLNTRSRMLLLVTVLAAAAIAFNLKPTTGANASAVETPKVQPAQPVPANPLLAMDNVIVTPHSLCWTDECFHNMAATGLRSIVEVLNGRIPEFLVNRAVLQHARAAAWFRP